MSSFIAKSGRSDTFAKILVVPAVSMGNVPQLSCDLLIHTLSLPLLGTLDPSSVYPFVAPREDPDGSSGICTPLEVFGNDTLTLLQHRSPVLPRRRQQYIEMLRSFAVEYKFERILLLSSANAAYRNDQQLVEPIVRLSSSAQAEIAVQLSDLSLRDDDDDDDDDVDRTELSTVSEEEHTRKSKGPKLPGSGITLNLLQSARDDQTRWQSLKSIDVLCLWAYEGDNSKDAEYLADQAWQVLGLKEHSQWIRPPSWKYLFGPAVQIGIEAGMFW